jgi:hypothetical protein
MRGWYDGIAETVRGVGVACPGIGCIDGNGAGNVLRIDGVTLSTPVKTTTSTTDLLC